MVSKYCLFMSRFWFISTTSAVVYNSDVAVQLYLSNMNGTFKYEFVNVSINEKTLTRGCTDHFSTKNPIKSEK